MTDQQLPEAVRPAWLALNVMADAVLDAAWGEWHPEDGGTLEDWVQAKEGHYQAVRDDMATALGALELAGLASFDWDAEPPEPTILVASQVLGSDEPGGQR